MNPSVARYFFQTFKSIYTQFSDRDDYSCNEILPGFTCTLIDSAGKNELMLEKKTDQFRDAQVEFESLTTSVRAMLNTSFLYFVAPPCKQFLKETVFVHSGDFDKTDRRSIITTLIRNDVNDFAVRVVLLPPVNFYFFCVAAIENSVRHRCVTPINGMPSVKLLSKRFRRL